MTAISHGYSSCAAYSHVMSLVPEVYRPHMSAVDDRQQQVRQRRVRVIR